MCGITGWIDWTKDLTVEHVARTAMVRSLARRGPDAEGEWVSTHVFLGHRRLSIIDLVAGQQPMSSDQQDTLVISYSGEVYNFIELRRELEHLGRDFSTRSDTEVVLQAFLQWGPNSFKRLRGMYAFALWDSRSSELWLVRDRFGIKPLYYYETHGGILFGSEPKAVLANPSVKAAVDENGLCELLAMSTAPTPGHGIYSGLKQVRPGYVLRVSRTGIQQRRYWSLPARRHTEGEAETADRVRSLLEQIVSQQLVSDVPLGSLLSGGLDSTVISAFAARSLTDEGRRLPTYSVDFPTGDTDFTSSAWQNSWDEPYAREAAQYIGSDHQTVVVPPSDVLTHDDHVLTARDGPGWGELDTSLYLLCKHVRARTTVALSGESADEVFGGYPFFHDEAALARGGLPWLRDGHGPWSLLREGVAKRLQPQAYIEARTKEALDEVPHLDGEDAEERRIREVTYLALTRWLPAMLDRKDRMSMATGLEVRVPFCDHELIEYVWNIPWRIRAKDGVGKAILRRAVGELVPHSILTRKKSGFPANPARDYADQLRQQACKLTSDRRSPIFDILCIEKVTALIDAGKPLPSPRASASPTAGLSYLLNLDRWLRHYDVAPPTFA